VDSKYIPAADSFIEEGIDYRRIAASVAANSITGEEFRDRAEKLLIRFFNDEDKQIRQQADDVFGKIGSSDLGRFIDLVWHYLKSKAFYDDDAFFFFNTLKDASLPIHEFVIHAAEFIIEDSAHNESHHRQHDLFQLMDLLKHEYAASEKSPEIRRRFLDIIDKMLEKELYGIDEILKVHERE